MQIDSFKFLSRLVGHYYQLVSVERELPIPWTPVTKAIKECKFGLVTSGGIYQRGVQPPFDLEGEQRIPSWGDPSYRVIPIDIPQSEVGVSHFHVRPDDILDDINILLPVRRMQELVELGEVGGQAQFAYSFMGYQGFPADLSDWRDIYGPQVAELLREEGVDCILMTTA